MNEYDRIVLALSDIAGWTMFALVVGGLILALVLGGVFVERLLPPRVDRHREFRNLSRNGQGRRHMAAGRSK